MVWSGNLIVNIDVWVVENNGVSVFLFKCTDFDMSIDFFFFYMYVDLA